MPAPEPLPFAQHLLLIRHGETPLNVARVLQPPDTPLSATGQAQAQALARRLAQVGLVGILCSDLPRARQTAEHLALATGLPVHTTALLQERNFGDLRGLPYDGLATDPLKMAEAPPGGESQAVFEERVARAFEHALAWQARLGGALAVVTHGLVVKAMLQRHATPLPGQVAPARMSNASLSVVGCTPPHIAELMDCTAHLADGLAEAAGSLSGG
jgi:broad specificity phosphatase PhoE